MQKVLIRDQRCCGLQIIWVFPEKKQWPFGDGENDIPMIKAAGIGVAMENALDTVKEAADTITLNNDEDGVAAAIRKFIFGSSEE